MTETEVAISGNNTSCNGDTEIDLYADVVENELETGADDDFISADHRRIAHDEDLYDDVITTKPLGSDFSDVTITANHNHIRSEHFNGSITGRITPSNSYNSKRVSLYIGQLTWWTTDADLTNAIHDLGVTDLFEVKFIENRVNGQSKGFAMVTVGSDASARILTEKMPKREIYNQNPSVLPGNKQSLSFLEGITRKDAPMEQMAPISVPPLHPMIRPPIGLPLPMPRGGHVDGPYRFPPQGSVLLSGAPPGMTRQPMQMTLAPRGPMHGGPMVFGRMTGPHPSGVHPSQPLFVMQRPGLPPGTNGSPLVRSSIAPVGPVTSNSMTVMPGQHPSGYYPTQPGQAPPHGVPMPSQQHPDLYYRSVDVRSDPSGMIPISEAEFQDIMDRNKTVSSSAIARAVQVASDGDFSTAIETLVTAISLIRQSKVANDDRCKILISSLQDTLKGIEDKSYGQRGRHRSRSSSPRKRHRHRSRSSRDRNEYRRNEDYDGKYNREHRRR